MSSRIATVNPLDKAFFTFLSDFCFKPAFGNIEYAKIGYQEEAAHSVFLNFQ